GPVELLPPRTVQGGIVRAKRRQGEVAVDPAGPVRVVLPPRLAVAAVGRPGPPRLPRRRDGRQHNRLRRRHPGGQRPVHASPRPPPRRLSGVRQDVLRGGGDTARSQAYHGHMPRHGEQRQVLVHQGEGERALLLREGEGGGRPAEGGVEGLVVAVGDVAPPQARLVGHSIGGGLWHLRTSQETVPAAAVPGMSEVDRACTHRPRAPPRSEVCVARRDMSCTGSKAGATAKRTFQCQYRVTDFFKRAFLSPYRGEMLLTNGGVVIDTDRHQIHFTSIVMSMAIPASHVKICRLATSPEVDDSDGGTTPEQTTSARVPALRVSVRGGRGVEARRSLDRRRGRRWLRRCHWKRRRRRVGAMNSTTSEWNSRESGHIINKKGMHVSSNKELHIIATTWTKTAFTSYVAEKLVHKPLL
ncbi:hypothetical protein THAOC_08945, partial [Thalassiosira oceanica]